MILWDWLEPLHSFNSKSCRSDSTQFVWIVGIIRFWSYFDRCDVQVRTMQEFTANPKIDNRLGKVGYWDNCNQQNMCVLNTSVKMHAYRKLIINYIIYILTFDRLRRLPCPTKQWLLWIWEVYISLLKALQRFNANEFMINNECTAHWWIDDYCRNMWMSLIWL